jgi:F0F1-type ATP synthase membrane subunit b/b'
VSNGGYKGEIVIDQIDKTIPWGIDEVTSTIEQTKNEVGRILERELAKRYEQVAKDADGILAKAREEASATKDASLQQSLDIVNRAHKKAEDIRKAASKESDRMIAQATSRVEQITIEAEKWASNELGEKTREEAESITTEAKANASGIIEAAHRQTAAMWDNFKADLDKETKESEEGTRKKAEGIIESAHQESATIIAEAKQRAEQAIKMLDSTQ